MVERVTVDELLELARRDPGSVHESVPGVADRRPLIESLLTRGPGRDDVERAARAEVAGALANGSDRHDVERLTPYVLELAELVEDRAATFEVIDALRLLWNGRALEPLLRCARSSDDEIRLAVAQSITGAVDDTAAADAVEVVIGLTRDPEPRVRDWATFALAVSDVRSTRTTDALLARLDDEEMDVRSEAFIGLAERGEERGIAPLIQALRGAVVSTLAVKAAGTYGDPRFIPALDDLRAWWSDDDPTGEDTELLDWALSRCRDPETA